MVIVLLIAWIVLAHLQIRMENQTHDDAGAHASAGRQSA